MLAREAWSKRDSHAQASAIKSTATPYSSSTGMGRLMYIFMFLYLFLERAGNPLDFAMMERRFQGLPRLGGLAACKTLGSLVSNLTR